MLLQSVAVSSLKGVTVCVSQYVAMHTLQCFDCVAVRCSVRGTVCCSVRVVVCYRVCVTVCCSAYVAAC